MSSHLTEIIGQLTVPAMFGSAVAGVGITTILQWFGWIPSPKKPTFIQRAWRFICAFVVLSSTFLFLFGALASVIKSSNEQAKLASQPVAPPPLPDLPKFRLDSAQVQVGDDTLIVWLTIINGGASSSALFPSHVAMRVGESVHDGYMIKHTGPIQLEPASADGSPPKTLLMDDFLPDKTVAPIPRFSLVSGFLMYRFEGLPVYEVFRETAELLVVVEDGSGASYTNVVKGNSKRSPSSALRTFPGMKQHP